MKLSVNGRAIDTVSVRDGWSDAAFRIPAQVLVAGMNRLDFAYAYCGSADDVAAGSRCLAVAFDLIRISS